MGKCWLRDRKEHTEDQNLLGAAVVPEPALLTPSTMALSFLHELAPGLRATVVIHDHGN